jgi:hypothetical protein
MICAPYFTLVVYVGKVGKVRYVLDEMESASSSLHDITRQNHKQREGGFLQARGEAELGLAVGRSYGPGGRHRAFQGVLQCIGCT